MAELKHHFRVGDVRVVDIGNDKVRMEKHEGDGQVYGLELPKQAYHQYINGDKPSSELRLNRNEYRFLTTHETPREAASASMDRLLGEEPDWVNTHTEGRGQAYGMEP